MCTEIDPYRYAQWNSPCRIKCYSAALSDVWVMGSCWFASCLLVVLNRMSSVHTHCQWTHFVWLCFFFLIFSSLLYLLYLLKCNGLCRGFCGSAVKNLPANAGDVGLILGLIRSPEEGGATDSSIASEIPWTEEPGMLQSTESWRVRHEVAAIQQQWYMYWT